MKTRIMAAVVLVPILLVLVLFAPKMFAAVILAVLMGIGSYELLYRTQLVKHPRLVVYASVMAFAITMWSYAGAVQAYMLLGLMVFTMLLFAEMMHDHVKIRIEMLGLCYIAGIIVHGNHGRFPDNNALAVLEDQNIGSAQIDAQVMGE